MSWQNGAEWEFQSTDFRHHFPQASRLNRLTNNHEFVSISRAEGLMDPRTIVILAQSVTLVDEMEFELSRLVPGLRVRAAVGTSGVLLELDRGDIAANVICQRGREEEPWLTDLLHIRPGQRPPYSDVRVRQRKRRRPAASVLGVGCVELCFHGR